MKKLWVILSLAVLFGLAWSQDTGTPGFRIKQTVHHCRVFEDSLIHPIGYILTSATNYSQGPVIYDIARDKLIYFPKLGTIPGIPQAPDVQPGTDEYKKLRQQGGLWKWGFNSTIVICDPEKGYVGLLLIKETTERTVQGAPPCPNCNETSSYIEKYHRYYCYGCRKYVEEKDYLKDTSAYYYARLDLSTKKVTEITEIPVGNMKYLVKDPQDRYLYFSSQMYFYGDVNEIKNIKIARFNLQTGKIDWQYTMPVTPRKKSEDLSSHSLSAEISPDGKKIVFIEYDEGLLHDPGPQAFFLDVASRSVAQSSIPPTAYGRVFDRENRWLFLGSNQKGTIHRYNLDTGKEELKVQASGTIFHLVLSPESQYIMVFNKKKIEVRKFPDLELVKTIPLSTLFKGVNQLLVSEAMLTTADGKYSVIGILKTDSEWAARDLNDGFYLLETLE